MLISLKTNKTKHKDQHRARLQGNFCLLDFTREELDVTELLLENYTVSQVAKIMELDVNEVLELIESYEWKIKNL